MCVCVCVSVYHHHVVFLARISQTLSLVICLYHSSLPTCLQDYILYPYRAVVDKFLLVVQHLDVRVKESIGDVAYEFVLIFPAESHISCSSYLDGFWDGRWVAVQLLFGGMLLPGFVDIARSILVQFPSYFFLHMLSQRSCSAYI